LQSTGVLHIGNYFGAIDPMVRSSRQLDGDDHLYLFVPDLHTLTIDLEYGSLYRTILDNVRVYLASGIEGTRPNIHVYRQSFVPAHSELCWILSCFTYFGEMSRMTQFKDKSAKNESNINVGLFSYPILMAGDILLYGADYVPIGEDQVQHLEIARDIAIRMNNKFAGMYPDGMFTVPRPTKEQLAFMHIDEPLRIRSLTHPEKKMSKSDESLASKILLMGDPYEEARKVMGATTDSFGEIKWDWQQRPGITNLLQILALATSTPVAAVRKEWEGQIRYGDLKKAVAASLENLLSGFASHLDQVTDEDVESVLAVGETHAREVAQATLRRVHTALGLRR